MSVVTSGLLHCVLTLEGSSVRSRTYIGMGGTKDNALGLYHDSRFQVDNVVAVAGTQVRDIGRIYCFCLTGSDEITVAYSDDDGQTWTLETPLARRRPYEKSRP